MVVAVIPAVPGQSKIAALEAAAKCLADSLQEARAQAIPLECQLCATFHDVVVLNAGAVAPGPAVVVYGPRPRPGSAQEGSTGEQTEEMPPAVGAWCQPYAATPVYPLTDERIFAQTHLLMHDAALLYALVHMQEQKAWDSRDLAVQEVRDQDTGKGSRGEYAADFTWAAHWHARRVQQIACQILMMYEAIDKVACGVFLGTGHCLEKGGYEEACQKIHDQLGRQTLKRKARNEHDACEPGAVDEPGVQRPRLSGYR
jgi:hypothetical protein